MSRRLTPRGKERRAQLLAYATQRFASEGYHPTSVADIVDGLGVGKGVFYWYFDSKEQLFVEILRSAQSDLRRRQQHAIEGEEDPVRRLELGVRAAVLWMAEHSDLRRLVEFARTETTFAKAIDAGQSVAVADAVVHLRQAIEADLIADRDPEALAHGILGVSNQLTSAYLDRERRDPEEVADLVVDICRRGFAGR